MMGLPILGSIYNIQNITRDMIVQYHSENYIGRNVVIVAQGDFEHEQFVQIAEEYFGDMPAGPGQYEVAS